MFSSKLFFKGWLLHTKLTSWPTKKRQSEIHCCRLQTLWPLPILSWPFWAVPQFLWSLMPEAWWGTLLSLHKDAFDGPLKGGLRPNGWLRLGVSDTLWPLGRPWVPLQECPGGSGVPLRKWARRNIAASLGLTPVKATGVWNPFSKFHLTRVADSGFGLILPLSLTSHPKSHKTVGQKSRGLNKRQSVIAFEPTAFLYPPAAPPLLSCMKKPTLASFLKIGIGPSPPPSLTSWRTFCALPGLQYDWVTRVEHGQREGCWGFKVIFILPLSLQGEILKLDQVSHWCRWTPPPPTPWQSPSAFA